MSTTIEQHEWIGHESTKLLDANGCRFSLGIVFHVAQIGTGRNTSHKLSVPPLLDLFAISCCILLLSGQKHS